MKYILDKKYHLEYSNVNQLLEIRLKDAFDMAQNNVTEYFATFNSDNIYIRKHDNAVWVVSKARIHFNKYCKWMKDMHAISYTTKLKPVRTDIETKFVDSNGDVIFYISQESCVLDIDSRKIRKVSSITYPDDMELEDTLFDGDYLKLNREFKDEDLVYSQRIMSQHLDYSNHTNNSMYITFLMDALPSKFFDLNYIDDFEIHYINESKEGEKLNIYKIEENNNIEFLIKENDGRIIIRANLKYKNR